MAGFCVDQRLKRDCKIICGNCFAKIGFEQVLFGMVFVKCRLVKDCSPATQILGTVHGKIGLTDQLHSINCRIIAECNADAGANDNNASVYVERLLEQAVNGGGHVGRILAGMAHIDENGEFVATKPCNLCAFRCEFGKFSCHILNQMITNGVAIEIIDVLETVEVEIDQGWNQAFRA